MAKIPLHNLFENVLHIGEIDTPEKMDELIARLGKEVAEEEKEEKVATKKNKKKKTA